LRRCRRGDGGGGGCHLTLGMFVLVVLPVAVRFGVRCRASLLFVGAPSLARVRSLLPGVVVLRAMARLGSVVRMLGLRRCIRGFTMGRRSVRFTVCAALQLSPLALGAPSHRIFLLVSRPAPRCLLAAQPSRRGLRWALNLGLYLRPAVIDRRRGLRRLRRPVDVGLATMPKLGCRLRGGGLRWGRGGGRGLRCWGAPASLGRLPVPFGLRWALLLRWLGPLGRRIEVLTVTWRGQSQDRLRPWASGACQAHHPWERRRWRAERAAQADFWRAVRRLRDISGSRLTEATGASESAGADAQHPHRCTYVWIPHHGPGHPPTRPTPLATRELNALSRRA